MQVVKMVYDPTYHGMSLHSIVTKELIEDTSCSVNVRWNLNTAIQKHKYIVIVIVNVLLENSVRQQWGGIKYDAGASVIHHKSKGNVVRLK